MTKTFCDKCGKELNDEKMDYINLSINDFSDNDADYESFQFCRECFPSVKISIDKNRRRFTFITDKVT